MAQKVVMPKLAMGMSIGTVISWKYAQGQLVEKGQTLLVIETEKVSYEIEALKSGYLHIVVPEGETVPVHTIIGYIAQTEEELAGLVSKAGEAAGTAPEMVAAEQPAQMSQETAGQSEQDSRVVASPVAKRLAQMNNIDLGAITGTGPGGRIQKEDVVAAIEARDAAPVPASLQEEAVPAVAAAPAAPAPMDAQGVTGKAKIKAVVPVKGMRKAVADSMMRSLSNAAQLSYSVEIDATEMVGLRRRLVAKEDKLGVRISYTDIIALACVRAIKKVPIVNASFVGNEILVWEDINLGIAIATEISEYECGLFVPVVKNAGCKSLFDISKEIKELANKAREGRLSIEDMQGGTVTLSSAAFVNLFASTPILNPGQALLIQPGPITEKPVVRKGEIVVRSTVAISFTFDHRICDGIPLGKMTKLITEYLEDPEMLL
jgi:pyruvate dehydrogenase E2 component (dihydrolipoamide acetyltransferase)/2-oxoglutarate dehydrogenase E2 component (dihydrolipoamide succinyltransferase)